MAKRFTHYSGKTDEDIKEWPYWLRRESKLYEDLKFQYWIFYIYKSDLKSQIQRYSFDARDNKEAKEIAFRFLETHSQQIQPVGLIRVIDTFGNDLDFSTMIK